MEQELKVGVETDVPHALSQALESFRDQAQDAEERIEEAVEKVRQLEKDQATQLANLKYELSKEILKQANAPITRATQALVFIISVVVVGGSTLTYFVSNNLQTTFESQMKHQVESWLSLENESSIASRTLDAYRTRALLDSYMIQLARQKASRGSSVRLDFRKGDQDRLLSIIESIDSQASDFLDALNLLSVSRGGWGFGARNDSVSQRLRALFKSAEFDINRKLSILNVMDRDEGLMPVAADIIEDPSQPQPLRFQAFRMFQNEGLDTSNGVLAHRYALQQLTSSQDPDRAMEVVQYLAKIDPFSQSLAAFLQTLDEQPRASKIVLRMAAADGWISLLPDTSFQSMVDIDRTNPPADREKLRQLIATNLSLAMGDGLSMGVVENNYGRPALSLHFFNTSGSRRDIDFRLDRLFTDTQLLSALFEIEQPNNLASFVGFFNTVYHDEGITNLRLKVPVAAFDVAQRQALGDQVEVQLKVSPEGVVNYRWTDRDGNVHQQPQLGAFKPTDIKIVFDRDYLLYKAPYDTLMF
ncbi:hypothetical protein [Pseudomonas sp. 1152_12]|uniref:hypothetical protein n=1 Tax=Pseudomonas sp. 1152_12 TaxID=2604455 RepID=UPI0040644632